MAEASDKRPIPLMKQSTEGEGDDYHVRSTGEGQSDSDLPSSSHVTAASRGVATLLTPATTRSQTTGRPNLVRHSLVPKI